MQISAPFGLRPAFHPSGYVRPIDATIASGYASNIYLGAPVGYIADGSIALSPAGGSAITGAQGAFAGVEYTQTSTGRRIVSNTWPASAVATDIVAYLTSDQNTVYEIQANATLAQDSIGNQYNWTVNDTTAGNTTTGISTVQLDVASAGANKGMRVIGISQGPDNAWGDPFPVVRVQLSQHQYVAAIAAI